MTEERYRNHPAILVKNIIVAVAVTMALRLAYGSVLTFIIGAGLLIYMVAAWCRTYITIYDDHAVLERKLIGTKTKNIPFGKVASVNEVQGIFGRIFGWTTLRININSSHNAAKPEISFTFGNEMASHLASLLKDGIHLKPTEDECGAEPTEIRHETEVPVYRFGTFDAVVFGLFGSNTYALIATLFWGALSMANTIWSDGVSLIAILMMIISGVVPMISMIIRHGNFSVYRKGDTIRLVHGMVTIYDTMFDTSKINAVCIKRTLMARLLGKCCLQAEVVGINAEAKDTTPTVTLLIPDKELAHAMEIIFPEFITDYSVDLQPSISVRPTASRTAIISGVWLAAVGFFFSMFVLAGKNIDAVISSAFIAGAVSVPAIAIVHAVMSLKVCRLGTGERMFTVVNGVVDRDCLIMQYSRTQITGYVMSPAARRHGLARAEIKLLSSAGGRTVKTAFFPEGSLDLICSRSVELSCGLL